MSLTKTYQRTNFVNYPSTDTPLNDVNLNKLDYAVDAIDDRVIDLDVSKTDLATSNSLIQSVSFDEKTGIFTFTKLNGSTFTIDTLLEKIIVNFDYNQFTQKLVIILEDGTRKEIDMSSLITEYEFTDSDTIIWNVSNGFVSASIPNGCITENKLQPNYLADIKVEVVKAETSASNALLSENASKTSENNAQHSAEVAQNLVDQAKSILSDIEFKLDADGHLYYKTDNDNIQFRVDPISGQLQFIIITN